MAARRLRRAFALALLATDSAAMAGQPLVTDDAAVVAAQTCQFEVWTRSFSEGREYSTQPACNFTGNLELSVGAARSRPADGDSSSIVLLQVKTVLFKRDDGVWSFGAVGGGVRDTGAPRGASAFQTYYAKALASWYPGSDLEIDFNLGAANTYGSGTFALAAVAIQYSAFANVQLLAELFRDEPGAGKYQVGARWSVIPDRLETYVSYGNPLRGSTDRWSWVIGLRLQTPALLP